MSATDLAVIPKESTLTVFSSDDGLAPYLAKIRAEIDAFSADVSTKKGRESIASIAHKVAKSKTYLDGVGKDLVAELKELPKKIDASRKQVRDTLDAWKDEVRRPLTEWEEAEKERVNGHMAVIRYLSDMAVRDDDMTADAIQSRLSEVEQIEINEQWEEFEADIAKGKDVALTALHAALKRRQQYEAEQAELAKLRVEAERRAQQDREEKIARDAAEQARLAAEARARAERDEATRREADAKAAAERRELELRLEAEQAQRKAAEAEQRAVQAADLERARIEAERKAQEQAAAEREKDKAHRTAINRAAMQALVAGGLTESAAKTAVTLIIQKSVPGVTIAY